MTITLYHSPKSSASRRVRLCLEEKGLAYDGHVIDLSTQQQHSAAYLKINPMGVVPTMVIDGRPLHESSTMCEYLDAIHPETPLRPSDPYDLALMRNWIRYVDGLIGNLIRFNWRHGLARRAASMTDAEFEKMLENVPSAERKEAWRRAARQPYTEAELEESRAILLDMLDRMEAMIRNGGLIGGQYGLADIATAPFVRRIEEEIAPDAFATRPNCAEWWARLTARPAYAKADFGPFVT